LPRAVRAVLGRLPALSLAALFAFAAPASAGPDTLSLHDALPILRQEAGVVTGDDRIDEVGGGNRHGHAEHASADSGKKKHQQFADRKSTRLNSSHVKISYAVFCLKKKTVTPARARVLAAARGPQE